MGTFYATLHIGNLDGGDMVEVSAMVDTGAGYSMLPESLLQQLHIQPREQHRFFLADGRDVIYGIGVARIGLQGREWSCPVIFGPEDQYLLGATTLEIFGVMVDPLGERLIPREYRVRPI